MPRDSTHPTPGHRHHASSSLPADASLLVIRQGAFGDLLQADGALRAIRAHHPDARIALLVAPPYRRLMARCPHVDELILDERAPLVRVGANFALLRELRARDFDRVYDLQGSERTALYRRLMPDTRQWFRKRNPSGGETPDRVAYAHLLAQAGLPADVPEPDLSWVADDVDALLQAARLEPGYIALVPGSAARHAHKRWPGHAELARRLAALGHTVVVAPGPDEMELARSLPCRVLTGPEGPLDWFALAGVLRRAAFVIGNDTGPTHLAAGLGVPGLALFGPHTRAARTGIGMRAFEAIEVPDLATLTVDAVLAAVRARLR
ncbi:MAG TPA: glycosyltransferase family 9 protein [Lysobacter sp.]